MSVPESSSYGYSFNGAADFHPRKRTGAFEAQLIGRASMGPRTSIRGNRSRRSGRYRRTQLQWGRGLPSAETDQLKEGEEGFSRFNGAADFHPRKHRVSAVPPQTVPASMGPRTSIRGNCRPRRGSTSGRAGFNGAADFHPRKPGPVHHATVRARSASMGPRTSIRGNRLAGNDPTLRRRASMGPRTSIRGNIPDRGRTEPRHQASMGPRTSIRGNSGAAPHVDWVEVLQWGRGLPSAETSRSGTGRTTSCSCFNGAADFHPRKRDQLREHLLNDRASMGPRTSIRGNIFVT